MDLVTRFIFEPGNGLFVPLEEGALSVQPNPHPPPHVKLKHYRLAGTVTNANWWIRRNHFARRIRIRIRRGKIVENF